LHPAGRRNVARRPVNTRLLIDVPGPLPLFFRCILKRRSPFAPAWLRPGWFWCSFLDPTLLIRFRGNIITAIILPIWIGLLLIDLILGGPVLPNTVARYLADRARSLKYSTLRRRLSTISVADMRAGRPFYPRHPAIAEALQAIAQKPGTAYVRKRPLVLADVRAVVRQIPHDLAGLRDRTMLLLGFAGALRVAEFFQADAIYFRDPLAASRTVTPRAASLLPARSCR
jgi:hypothetical protein